MYKQLTWTVILVVFMTMTILFEAKKVMANDVVIGTVNVAPRGFIDKEGVALGGSYEIVNKIAEEAGLSYVNHLVPFARLFRQIKQGIVDVALLVPNKKINEISIPLIYIRDVNFIIVGKKGSKIDDLSEMVGKKVRYLRRSVISAQIAKSLDVHESEGNNYASMLEMLLAGRIDFVIGPKTNIYWTLRELNYPADKLGMPLSVKKLKMYLVYAKKTADEKVMSALIIAAEKLKKAGEIQAIINKYDYSKVE